ncbi:ABC transporter ATP-binding protein [Peptostreptococcus faecalis]|uniref:ABC transporter ATP-binding protein n=1 Tax=Peptostreptococcus faecalis TaxID=2045015 RepID=UPI000C7B79DE|nr:ABC transporter ATP-binding protein [Peptostreptococcus faecalis]
MNNIVKLKNIKKNYGKHTVVSIDELKVKKGEIYGLIGPNGAGKSTIMKMICSITSPSKGDIIILGNKVNDKNRSHILKSIGSIIEGPCYYENLTGMENMKIVRDLKNLNNSDIDKAISIVGLKNQMDKKVNHYSLGMKQRLGIAMAIIGFPKLLILDEPTNGLDPQGMDEIRELIKSLSKNYGLSIFISSHILDEVEKMVDTIGIINRGNIIYKGSLEDFKVQHGSQISVKTSNNEKSLLLLEDYNPKLEVDVVQLPMIEDKKISEIIKILVNNNIDIYRVFESTQSLEKLFINMTGKGDL